MTSPLPSFHSVRRLAEVAATLAKYGLADWLGDMPVARRFRPLESTDGVSLAGVSRAARIRMVLTELGTTYIKLGQMLSTRADLVGPETAAELARLQRAAPADPPETVFGIVAAELKRPVAELFTEFVGEPIGSGSIAQVHHARLADGRAVVVKVQHPGIEEQIRGDLEILQQLATLAEHSKELRRFRPQVVVAEFRRSLLRELDFHRERANLEQFTANFADDPSVHFPIVVGERSSGRVLTMEWIAGAAPMDVSALEQLPFDRAELARHGAAVWLQMIFRDGFFHADPHPGNLLVRDDGVIAVIDCGKVGRVDEALRENIEDALLAVTRGDSRRLSELLMFLCSAPPEFDLTGFSTDVADLLGLYASQPIDRFQLGSAVNDIVRIISEYRLTLPPGVSSLLHTVALLESTVQSLSPGVNVMELIRPYAREVLLRRHSPRARLRHWQRTLADWRHVADASRQVLADVLRRIQTGQFEIKLEHRRLEPAANRLAMALISSSLFIGSALLWTNQTPPLVHGHPIIGIAGCAVGVALGARVLRRTWKD